MSVCRQTGVSDEGEEEEKQKRDATDVGQDPSALHSRPATSNCFEDTFKGPTLDFCST